LPDEVGAIISSVSLLPIASVDVGELWRGAVAGHPADDTLFVELAIRLRTSVASFDRRFQQQSPAIV